MDGGAWLGMAAGLLRGPQTGAGAGALEGVDAMNKDDCCCDWPTGCGGHGYVYCGGCGGDLCICLCGGQSECYGCSECDDGDDFGSDDE